MTKTTLTRASNKTSQLRTTVPLWIVEQYNLRPGDKLDWHQTGVGGTAPEISLKVIK